MEGLFVERSPRVFCCAKEELVGGGALVIGVPYDGTSSFMPGSRHGPRVVRDVSWELETFDPYLKIDLEDIDFGDIGNVDVLPQVEETIRRTREVVDYALSKKAVPVILGGEHTVSIGAIDVLRRADLLVVYDAHMDMRDEYPAGSRISHATVMRRIFDITGHTPIYVGARAFSKEEWSFCAKVGCRVVRSIRDLELGRDPKVYVSIDVDVIEPGVACGVGNPEPGGLLPRELLDDLVLLRNAEILGVDIVEYNPLRDCSLTTAFITARIVAKMIMIISPK